MPQKVIEIAQLAMDSFYQNYKSDDDFWDIQDFVSVVGNTISAMYLQFYKAQYDQLRQERKEEVVSFDSGWLLAQELEVKKDNNRFIAYLKEPVMSFLFDSHSSGVQNIFIVEPFMEEEAERTSLSSVWQLKYAPNTNKIFFVMDVYSGSCGNESMGRVVLINKKNCNIKKIRVLYVPTMGNENSYVPDGIVSEVIIKSVAAMKEMAQGVVVDQTNNGNPNKIIQSEIDKSTLT